MNFSKFNAEGLSLFLLFGVAAVVVEHVLGTKKVGPEFADVGVIAFTELIVLVGDYETGSFVEKFLF